MKTLERIGAWVIGGGWAWFAIVVISAISLQYVATSEEMVSISGKNFECTATDSVGIKARCTQYTMRRLNLSISYVK
jgi:hypothetical protein